MTAKKLWIAPFLSFLCFIIGMREAVPSSPPKYSHLPMHEVMQQAVYLHTTSFDEIVISHADRGSELRPGDYLTHADGIRVLNGGLGDFLRSGEKEIIVPVVEQDDAKFGGKRLLGFVMLQAVSPRKLSVRRGEVDFDLNEGGPPPTLQVGNIVVTADGAKTTSDPDYSPPPHGGGACITGRDCFHFNGTCTLGQCSCIGVHTGSYCQLNRPDFATAAMRKKMTQQFQQQKAQQQQQREAGMSAKRTLSEQDSPVLPTKAEDKPPVTSSTSDNNPANKQQNTPPIEKESQSAAPKQEGLKKKKKKRKLKPGSETEKQGSTSQQNGEPVKAEEIKTEETKSQQDASPQQPEAAAKELTVEELYGPGKAYPEPNIAGRLPGVIVTERHKRRTNREPFIYSVRFRTGPLGIVFDNKIPDASIVEQVVKGQQAQQSDIKEGDQLIAIEHYNVTTAPAKITLRILNSLPWPRTLVFETRYKGEDPTVIEQKKKSRSFNITVVYPPTLVGEYSFRLSEWTPSLNLASPSLQILQQRLASRGGDFCPLFRLKGTDDPFGCRPANNHYKLPESFNDMLENNGFVPSEVEKDSQFLAMLLQNSFTKKLHIEPRSMAIMKRGECTFVEKAKSIAKNGADAGLVVNTDNEMLDMPAGKEKTAECTSPFGLLRHEEGNFLHLAARTNEIWAMMSDSSEGLSPACEKLATVIEDLIDRWPHTVPPLPSQAILQSKAPDQSKVRGITEEGGRVALSGENGWVFFDYHLAMFGPQEVPLGPIRLVMAMPPFGCDPSAYTVRITDAVVAILRGGGCSFGIKVINAQKLGAKAVMIVNTDDKKTMRLMALPDEVPLIKIPCIMVSRRIQFYLEEQIRPYFPIDQHLVSIQPTGVFGDYESKNSLKLPTRIS